MKRHLTEEELIEHKFKLASDEQAAGRAEHLAGCAECRERLELLGQKFAALDLLREEPELLGFEKLRLLLEDDLLELTLDPEELLPEDLSVLRDERTFDEWLDEDPEFLLAGATRRLEVEVFGLAIEFSSLVSISVLCLTICVIITLSSQIIFPWKL